MTPLERTNTHRIDRNNKPTILVVEDNELMRAVFVEMLFYDGIPALEAGNASEALRVLETRDVDAMLTDIDMRGPINGLALAAIVRARWPELPILITSGGGAPSAAALPTGSDFIPKPFSRAQLVQRLNAVLLWSEV